jgi:hypothetical protein
VAVLSRIAWPSKEGLGETSNRTRMVSRAGGAFGSERRNGR